MSNADEDDRKLDSYLEDLKAEGADLLIRAPQEGSVERARLSLIDAKIEQLTSPITKAGWNEPND